MWRRHSPPRPASGACSAHCTSFTCCADHLTKVSPAAKWQRAAEDIAAARQVSHTDVHTLHSIDSKLEDVPDSWHAKSSGKLPSLHCHRLCCPPMQSLFEKGHPHSRPP